MTLGSAEYFTLMLIILTISLIIYTILLNIVQRRSMKEVVKSKTITKIVCEGEDYSEEREFRKGDYVGLVVGTCPRCGRKVLVHAIYLVGSTKERQSV